MQMPRIIGFLTRRLFLESLHLLFMREIGGGQRRDHFRVTAWGRFGRIIAVENKLNRCSQSAAESQAAGRLESCWSCSWPEMRRGERTPPPSLSSLREIEVLKYLNVDRSNALSQVTEHLQKPKSLPSYKDSGTSIGVPLVRSFSNLEMDNKWSACWPSSRGLKTGKSWQKRVVGGGRQSFTTSKA